MQLIARPYTVSDAAAVAANTAARHTQGTDAGLDTGGDNAITAEHAKSAYALSHTQNTDTILDYGGDDQISVSTINNVALAAHVQGSDQHLDEGGDNEISAYNAKVAYLASHSPNTDQYLDYGGDNQVVVTDVKDAVDKKHASGADTTLGTMAGNIAMNGHNLTGAGIISGGLDVIDIGENTVLTPAQCLSTLCLVSGAYTVTLPAVSTAAEGANVTVYSTTAALIKVDLNDVDRFILDGVALTDAYMLDSESGAGDYVTVIKDSAVGWTVIGRSGTWTDGGTS